MDNLWLEVFMARTKWQLSKIKVKKAWTRYALADHRYLVSNIRVYNLNQSIKKLERELERLSK